MDRGERFRTPSPNRQVIQLAPTETPLRSSTVPLQGAAPVKQDDLIDKMKAELISSVAYSPSLIEEISRYSALRANPDAIPSIRRSLWNSQGGRWNGWSASGTETSSYPWIAALWNKTYAAGQPSEDGRNNTSHNTYLITDTTIVVSSVPSLGDLKPDILFGQRTHLPGRWDSSYSFVNVKYNTFPQLLWQSGTYARALLAHHDSLLFVYAALWGRNEVTFVRFDRAGVVLSKSLPINGTNSDLLHAMSGLGLIVTRLFDQTYKLVKMPDGSTLNFIKFPGPNGQLLELQVIGLLHSSICVRGRAGRIYLVLYEGRRCILKDAWVDITRNFEGDILAQCGNAYGLPRFLAQSKFGYDTTYPDVVPSHRYQDRFSRETRERVRILMATYGRPLSEYRSNPIKLLWAIYSAILGHWYLLKKGYLHRDVSNTNILVLDEPQPYDPIPEHIIPSALINPASSCTGVLIDVDMALKVDNSGKRKLEDPPKEKRTGATAFMSINMVFKIDAIPGPPQQTFYDDLESFFWVIVWVAFGIAIKSDRDIGKSEQRLWNASIEKAVRQNISNTTIDALGGNVGKSALTFSTFWETKVCFDPSSQPYVGVCRSLASLLFDSGRYTVPFRRSNQDLAYTRVLHAILEAIIELSKDQTTG